MPRRKVRFNPPCYKQSIFPAAQRYFFDVLKVIFQLYLPPLRRMNRAVRVASVRKPVPGRLTTDVEKNFIRQGADIFKDVSHGDFRNVFHDIYVENHAGFADGDLCVLRDCRVVTVTEYPAPS